MSNKRTNANDKAKAHQVIPLSYEKFLEIASTTDNSRYPRSLTQSADSRSWADGVSFDESVKRLKLGWPEGVAKAKELASKLEARLSAEYSFQTDTKWDVTGDYFDIGRVLEGEPDCWASDIELEDQYSNDKKGKIVRVLVNVATSCHYDADIIFQRGVYALAIVDLLERLGKSVELVASCKIEVNYGDKGIYAWELPLKKAGEELSLDRVAFVLGSPAGFRRSWFSVITNRQFPDCGSNLGMPTDWTETELKQREVDIYIGALMSGSTEWQGKTDLDFIVKQLSKAGISVDKATEKVG